MGERDHSVPEEQKIPWKRAVFGQNEMFPEGEDLPLFSGTPQAVEANLFQPQVLTHKQPLLPGMPGIDYDHIYEKDKARQRGRKRGRAPATENGTLFIAGDPDQGGVELRPEDDRAMHLREALAAYQFDVNKLRQIAQGNAELVDALRNGTAPEELVLLLSIFAAVLQPTRREQIKSPTDAVALLMLEMSHLDQEQMRVLCLDTKNRLQKIHTVYKGTLNTAVIRVGELFKEPVRLNSAAIILAHNHPSGDPSPSPEDVFITRQAVEAGKLLDCEVLDHLIIGQGNYVSLRERGLGFV